MTRHYVSFIQLILVYLETPQSARLAELLTSSLGLLSGSLNDHHSQRVQAIHGHYHNLTVLEGESGRVLVDKYTGNVVEKVGATHRDVLVVILGDGASIVFKVRYIDVFGHRH